jgi:hypothetical protein
LLEDVDLPGGNWLEPAAGEGAIIAATHRSDVEWTAWELRESTRSALEQLLPASRLTIGDFVEASRSGLVAGHRYDVAITNPPFSLAQAFIEASLDVAERAVMLLRLNYLASQKRSEFMRRHAPDVYVLPKRPSFTGKGTDSIEYAWFVFSNQPRTEGRVRVLSLR